MLGRHGGRAVAGAQLLGVVGREAAEHVAVVAGWGGQVDATLLRPVTASVLRQPLHCSPLAHDAEVEAAAVVDVLEVAAGTTVGKRGEKGR